MQNFATRRRAANASYSSQMGRERHAPQLSPSNPPPRVDAPRDADREVRALAHASGPLRRALARIAGRMVATRGWERLGFARPADYATERLGISARELRDLARVDRALADLPRLDQGFVAGELGWTQLRLLCRVVRPEDEAQWLDLALRLTAPALAREVRCVDRCARDASAPAIQPDEDDERRVGVVVRCTPPVRARWWHARQVANRMAGQTLPIAAFIEAVTAEVISAVGVEGELPESGKSMPRRPDEEGGASDGEPWLADGEGARNASAKSVPSHGFECEPTVPIANAGPPARTEPLPPPPFVVDLTRDLDTADAFELDARLCRAVRLETRQLAQLAACLEHAVAHGLPRALGFSSLDAYAEERLAMAPSRARALLRVARAGSECPPLRKAFGAGRLSWVQAHALVPLMFEPAAARHTRAWVAHAERVSVRRLCDDVERALAARAFAPPTGAPRPRSDDVVLDRPHLQFGAERVRLFFAAPLEVAHLFRAALATVQRRLEHVRQRPASQGEALSAMLGHALGTWVAHDPHQTAPRDRRVFERDGWRCTVPGCSSYRNLHGHHIVFRSNSGSHALTNLTTLCAWHHQRGIHGSGLHAARIVSCGGRAPNALYFALGLRRHRSPLLTYGPGEVRIT